MRFFNPSARAEISHVIRNLFIAGNGTCMDEEDGTTDPYKRLEEEEKQKVRTLLYIMDRFSISLQGYHELSQVETSLPRTHLIETCAKQMDSQWEIKRTPGSVPGAELPLKLLLEKEIRQHVHVSATEIIVISMFIS